MRASSSRSPSLPARESGAHPVSSRITRSSCWHEPTEPTLVAATQQSWHRFLESFEPLRPDLYRFCRLLTRSAIDAEDLSQETLTRGFAAMGRLAAMPGNPRAWLFRVATNAWIDATRRSTSTSQTNETAVAEPLAAAAPEPGARPPRPRAA